MSSYINPSYLDRRVKDVLRSLEESTAPNMALMSDLIIVLRETRSYLLDQETQSRAVQNPCPVALLNAEGDLI